MLLGDSIEFDASNGALVVRILRERIVYPPLPSLFSAAVMHGADCHPDLDVILDLIWVRYLSSAALTELLRIRDHQRAPLLLVPRGWRHYGDTPADASGRTLRHHTNDEGGYSLTQRRGSWSGFNRGSARVARLS